MEPTRNVVIEQRAPERSRSLDVFRGLTIIGMLLVNQPGDASSAYAELRHAAWNGWTGADLVFPFFLFVVGITTHLSLRSRVARGDDPAAIRWQILRRGGLIFLIGFLLNWFPFYQFGSIPGHPSPTFVDRVLGRLYQVRFLGVLQRIGIAYIVAALVSWRASARRIAGIAVVLLLGYWMGMTLLPVPGEGVIGAALLNDKAHTLAAWVDRVTLDWSRWGMGNHIWSGSVVFDPEGLLSTVPAIATTLIGVLAGRWLSSERPPRERLRGLFGGGIVMTLVGIAWGSVFAINKNLWTSSYVLLTAGVACVVLGVVIYVIDVRQVDGWTRPFVAFGVNPITAYVGAELSAVLLDSTIKLRIDGRLASAHALFYERALAPWLEPRASSLAYSLCFVALWYGILVALYRRGIRLKV
jgi:predicted acyltransferase